MRCVSTLWAAIRGSKSSILTVAFPLALLAGGCAEPISGGGEVAVVTPVEEPVIVEPVIENRYVVKNERITRDVTRNVTVNENVNRTVNKPQPVHTEPVHTVTSPQPAPVPHITHR